MKRRISLSLAVVLIFSLLQGCNLGGGGEKIDLNEAKYSIREPRDLTATTNLSDKQRTALDGCVDAILISMGAVPSDAYTFDFSVLSAALGLTEGDCEGYLLPKLEEKSQSTMVTKGLLYSAGAWAVPVSDGFEDDIKCLWANVYENPDGNDEYVIDVSRNGLELYSLRYIEKNGVITEKQNNMAVRFDGVDPADKEQLVPEETGTASNMYFSGRLYRTGIFESPVLEPASLNLTLSGKPVDGEVPGGFAGMFEGTITIDGYAMSLTTDGVGMNVPVGMIENPADYYIAFSKVATANPQDKTGYRNVYFIKKDLSSICGLYMAYKNIPEINDWFEFARVTKASYDAQVKENNEKITKLYSQTALKAYGNRKEYNYALAVIYNMMIGVDKNYLEKNMKTQIADISKDIRDYSSAIQDGNLVRLGENGYYFFPDSRSMVVRLFSYDGENAIVAIDFSTKQDDGYGGLYRAVYTEDGSWRFEVLKDTRIS
jgi:hypothetical protein